MGNSLVRPPNSHDVRPDVPLQEFLLNLLLSSVQIEPIFLGQSSLATSPEMRDVSGIQRRGSIIDSVPEGGIKMFYLNLMS